MLRDPLQHLVQLSAPSNPGRYILHRVFAGRHGGVDPAEHTPSLVPPLTPRQFQQVAELGPIMQDQGALAVPELHALTTPDVPQAPSVEQPDVRVPGCDSCLVVVGQGVPDTPVTQSSVPFALSGGHIVLPSPGGSHVTLQEGVQTMHPS